MPEPTRAKVTTRSGAPLRLLFISKRRPQSRDLLTRPYGRFFNIPRELAARGHQATLLLVDYASAAREELRRDDLSIVSIGSRRNPLRAWRDILDIARADAPHWIIGFSDIWFGIAAARLARHVGARYAVDAYDNYESYIPWAWPAHAWWRRAIADADLVTAAGQPLLDYITRGGRRSRTAVVPMAADAMFFPRDRSQCRLALRLPLDSQLIGYAGSLHASRDTELLLALMRRLAGRLPSVRFVMSGRRLQRVDLPPNTCHLGYLPDEQVPLLVNAMDAMLCLNRASSFGDHSYPAKLYEASACGIPCIAASTRATRWMAAQGDLALYEPGSLSSLEHCLGEVLSGHRASRLNATTWADSAAALDALLQES